LQWQREIALFVERHGAALDPEHPARAIASGAMPDELVERARALVLATLRF